MNCAHGGSVTLESLAPDLAMADFEGARVDFERDILIEQEVAQGGFGVIFKAQYQGATVAVKQLKEEKTQNLIKAYDEFRREVWLMSSLKHPNIVCLQAYTVKPFAMIMEWLPCGDLYTFLQDHSKPMEWDMGLKVAYDIGAGMAHQS